MPRKLRARRRQSTRLPLVIPVRDDALAGVRVVDRRRASRAPAAAAASARPPSTTAKSAVLAPDAQRDGEQARDREGRPLAQQAQRVAQVLRQRVEPRARCARRAAARARPAGCRARGAPVAAPPPGRARARAFSAASSSRCCASSSCASRSSRSRSTSSFTRSHSAQHATSAHPPHVAFSTRVIAADTRAQSFGSALEPSPSLRRQPVVARAASVLAGLPLRRDERRPSRAAAAPGTASRA